MQGKGIRGEFGGYRKVCKFYVVNSQFSFNPDGLLLVLPSTSNFEPTFNKIALNLNALRLLVQMQEGFRVSLESLKIVHIIFSIKHGS